MTMDPDFQESVQIANERRMKEASVEAHKIGLKEGTHRMWPVHVDRHLTSEPAVGSSHTIEYMITDVIWSCWCGIFAKTRGEYI